MAQKFLIRQTVVNKTENHYIYLPKHDELEAVYADNKGDLFKKLQEEYGRCTGKMYIDTAEGEVIQVGWVFEASKKYEDVPEQYLHESWIEVFTKEPVTHIEQFRFDFK